MLTSHAMLLSQSCIATYPSVPPQLPPVPQEVNMQRNNITTQVDTRPQLVPNPGSPLSQEMWTLSDLDNWITESASLTTKGYSNYHPQQQQHYPQQQQQKIYHTHHSLHNIPSPGSPTLYESHHVGGPPPYVQVKQEVEEYGVVVKQEEVEEEEMMCSDPMEQLRRLACEQATKDISVACEHLGISPDPAMWSVADVNTWVLWILNQYNLSTDVVHHFIGMDGITLCNLTDVFFKKLPSGGDMLWPQLDIWKTAASMQRQNHVHLQQQQQQQQQTQLPQQQQQQLGFRPEESMLDISGLLDQWNYHRMSPPAGPGGGGGHSVVPDSSVASPVGSHDFSSDGIQSDDEISDESCDAGDRCAAPGGGRRPGGSHSHIHLWQFLKELLCQPHLHGSCIRWLDRPKGIFKIEDSVRVARLWGKRKNRPAMNYDKLSRSIRQYYKKGIMKKTERSQRLVYQFCHPYGL